MNACVQCLSHSMPLALYFVQETAAAAKGLPPSRTELAGGASSGNRTGFAGNGLPAAIGGGRSGERVGAREESLREAGEAVAAALELWAGEAAGAISPAELLSSVHKHVPHFAGFGQHDSQEFLRSLVDKLDEETRGQSELPKCHSLPENLDQLPEAEQADALWRQHCVRFASPIQQIFCGQLQSTIECLTCHHRSHCFDPFLDLSVPIPRRRFFSFRAPSIRDCLGELLAEETLQGDNAYSCSHCKKPSKAVRRLSVVRFPSILVIHIKRVASSAISLFQKDSTFVSCDLHSLDLSKFQSSLSREHPSTEPVSPLSPPSRPESTSYPTSPSGSAPPVYDLYAVTNHMGSLSSGHYTAHCRNPADGQWYLFNDSGVSPIAASAVISSSAYVLFYQLRHNPEGF
ncbi:unnamed protein product [Closterium sp. Naga37s-1]|nr:unnamed protein product [Closterium sp. Naga37s-1]